MLKLLVSLCVLLNAGLQTAPPASKSSRQLYEQAAQAIASADSRAAIEPLEQLIAGQPTSRLASIAAVHLAECYVAVERPADALGLLEKWSERVSETSKLSELDAKLDAQHLRIWLQAAGGIPDDQVAIKSLKVLAGTLAARENQSELSEAIADTRMALARRFIAIGSLLEAEAQLSLLNQPSPLSVSPSAASPSAASPSTASPEVQLLHAIVYQQLGEDSKARAALQALVTTEPTEGGPTTRSHRLARLELASYALQERDLQAANMQLKPLIEFQTGSDTAAIELDRELDCRFRLLWSELELAQGHPVRGLEILPSGEQLSRLDASQQIALRFGRAEAAVQAGMHSVALQELEWLSDYAQKAHVAPNWISTVMLRRCELLLKVKNYSRLSQLVAQAKAELPKFERLYEFDYLLARAAMQQIDFDRAREHLRSIIASSTTKHTAATARAQWMLGETYFLEQNLKEAIVAYQSVTELSEQQPWQTLALMQTAKCHELLNQANEAIKLYQRVVDNTHDDKIREEARGRLEVIIRTAARAKPSPLR